MPLDQSLSAASVVVGESITSSDDVLKRIAELLAANPLASRVKPERILRLLKEREAVSSTGLGHGIAIPHCACDNIEDFVIAILTLDHTIDFQSIDGKGTDIFFGLLGPKDARNQHIKLLSAISKFASQPDFIQRLRTERDPSAARAHLLQNLSYDESAVGKEKVLFQILVQNMEYFESILNLLSSVVPGSISVIETRNAGAYLFRMPLFAAFWTEKSEHEGRIIIAVAEKPNANNIIRQIQDITGDPDSQTGVVVTVQNLAYAAGTLDF